MNILELVPAPDGITAVVTKPNGDVTLTLMSWEEFERLRRALERERDDGDAPLAKTILP